MILPLCRWLISWSVVVCPKGVGAFAAHTWLNVELAFTFIVKVIASSVCDCAYK